jgi:hypothetical protein
MLPPAQRVASQAAQRQNRPSPLLWSWTATAILRRSPAVSQEPSRDFAVGEQPGRQPYRQVVDGWRECVARAYEPTALFARFRRQVEATYPHRLPVERKVTWEHVKKGLRVISRVLWTCGVAAPYRRAFWDFAWPRLKALDIERVIQVGVVAHHLITFASEASRGAQNASFYSAKLRPSADIAAPGAVTAA